MADIIQDQTKEALAKFAAKFGPAAIVPATVLAVNEDDTVQVGFSDGAQVDDARLKAVVKEGNKFLLVPKVGSTVQVARIENSDEYVVVAVEEITKLALLIGTVQLEVNETGFLFKKGSDSLGNIIQDLITEVLKIYAPKDVAAINLIKNRATQILTNA